MNMNHRKLGYVFAAGAGQVGRQSRHLLHSIDQVDTNAPVYPFIPNDEVDEIDTDLLDLLENRCEVLSGDIPIPDYPISTKIAALAAAEEVADTDYLLMLDTDMLILDEIRLHQRSDADLFLKPVDVGRQFWGRDKSHPCWERLYAQNDLEFPDWRVESTFDSRMILPYWNAGFVFARRGTLGAEWLDLTVELHGEIPYDHHADQVALGILSTRYDVDVVGPEYDFPLHLHLYCPSDVKVLHYHNEEQLSKVWDRDLRAKIRRTGASHGMTRYSLNFLRFMLYSLTIWARRKTLPIDETHALERLYLKVDSLR